MKVIPKTTPGKKYPLVSARNFSDLKILGKFQIGRKLFQRRPTLSIFWEGKSTLWTNTGQDWNFQRTLRVIGPYEFRWGNSYGPIIGPYLFLGKLVWTNGPESSSKVSPYTGIGPWMALPSWGCILEVTLRGQERIRVATPAEPCGEKKN